MSPRSEGHTRMGVRITGRTSAAMVGIVGASLLLGACGGSDGGDTGSATSKDCAAYKQYGNLNGKTVTIYTGIVDARGHRLRSTRTSRSSSAPASPSSTRATSPSRRRSWSAPRPATRRTSRSCRSPACSSSWSRPARPSRRRPRSRRTSTSSGARTGRRLRAPSTASSTRAPLGANVKSLVWYSPEEFKDKRLHGPDDARRAQGPVATRSPRTARSRGARASAVGDGDRLAGHRLDGRHDAPALRRRTTYDKWVNHEIPFNGPEAHRCARRGRAST